MAKTLLVLASWLSASSLAQDVQFKKDLLHTDFADASSGPAADEDCGAEGDAMIALQVQTRTSQELDSQVAGTCEGAWCSTVEDFSKMFDTNEPYTMQKAVNKHTDYATWNEGIKLAVTRDASYEMYHGNVATKLQQYLPQGLFEWHFNPDVTTIQPTNATHATAVRTGTISFNLGYWKRKMFWQYAVKSLPKGESFPFSEVTEFEDCTNCPAKMLFRLKKGGLSGDANKGWKIVDLILIKLK